ncbi:MAG: ROK family protein [Planctomycetes bacterium]|jgi:glucokinase|nr:ROK family protein [Phycisphaerae bacterium]NBB95630.1 ROK family protein [Planctomycetota bacterium]
MDDAHQRFIGVDVGGTKIHAAVVRASGQAIKRHRLGTPQGATAPQIRQTIEETIRACLDAADLTPAGIGGIGLAVPGIVDYEQGQVCAAPNIGISGEPLREPLARTFGVPVALGNDVDASTLGEFWVGSARQASSVIGIFVGTGIGGGIFVNRKLIRGERYSSVELGHMIMDIGGPLCGCGSHGCLEAIASRTAIERDIRAAIKDGKSTVVRKLLDDINGRIRSGVLNDALEADDTVVTGILRRAAEAIGLACISLRHLLTPDVIVLGGGVMEACGHFIMPIVQETVAKDTYLGDQAQTQLIQSVLADDAGILGAAALGMQAAGIDPLDRSSPRQACYPKVLATEEGVTIDGRPWTRDVMVRVSGRPKKRKRKKRNLQLSDVSQLTVDDIRRACKGGPELLFIAGPGSVDDLQSDVRDFLTRHAIEIDIRPRDEGIRAFNEHSARKALLALVAPTRS